MTEPGGWTATFTYDSNGELARISEPGDRALTFAHDSSGDLITATMPDGSLRTLHL